MATGMGKKQSSGLNENVSKTLSWAYVALASLKLTEPYLPLPPKCQN